VHRAIKMSSEKLRETSTAMGGNWKEYRSTRGERGGKDRKLIVHV